MNTLQHASWGPGRGSGIDVGAGRVLNGYNTARERDIFLNFRLCFTTRVLGRVLGAGGSGELMCIWLGAPGSEGSLQHASWVRQYIALEGGSARSLVHQLKDTCLG